MSRIYISAEVKFFEYKIKTGTWIPKIGIHHWRKFYALRIYIYIYINNRNNNRNLKVIKQIIIKVKGNGK